MLEARSSTRGCDGGNASLTVKKSSHETLLMMQHGRLTQQQLSQVTWWELFLEAGEKQAQVQLYL